MRKLISLLFVIGMYLIQGESSMAQEQIKLSPSEQLAYSTVRIEVMSVNGIGTGTGFFFSFLQDDSKNVPVIVTNKHVVRGARQGKIILTGTKSDGYPDPSSKLPVVFDNFESLWIPHPDPAVDLSIMPLAPLLTQAHSKNFTPFLRWFDKSIVSSEAALKQLTAVEDILITKGLVPRRLRRAFKNIPY